MVTQQYVRTLEGKFVIKENTIKGSKKRIIFKTFVVIDTYFECGQICRAQHIQINHQYKKICYPVFMSCEHGLANFYRENIFLVKLHFLFYFIS